MRVSSPWAYTTGKSPGKSNPWLHLTAAIVANAVQEVIKSKDPVQKCDAVGWLVDKNSTCAYYCEMIDLDYAKLREWASQIDLRG